MKYLRHNNKKFWLSHYPHRSWQGSNRSENPTFHLFGHSHGDLTVPRGRLMDVGVDAVARWLSTRRDPEANRTMIPFDGVRPEDYRPIGFDEVVGWLEGEPRRISMDKGVDPLDDGSEMTDFADLERRLEAARAREQVELDKFGPDSSGDLTLYVQLRDQRVEAERVLSLAVRRLRCFSSGRSRGTGGRRSRTSSPTVMPRYCSTTHWISNPAGTGQRCM